ncbi:MAG: hypothetical protein ACK44A_03770 [Roseateles sp.]
MPAHAAAALLLACGVAAAAEELPGTPACRAALQALEHAEAALVAAAAASAGGVADADRRRDIAARLFPQRQRVADACLGGLTTSPPPSQRSGMLPAPAYQAPSRMPPPARPAEPPLRWQTPLMIGSCNAATCVTSDGSMPTRAGPLLIGPRGACTQQGVFLSCP